MENVNMNPEIDDPLEIFKMSKEDAHVYKLLPMSSSEGYSSEDFTELIFRGKMKMTVKGEYMIVYFLNKDNSIFYVCIIEENMDLTVSRARDSTRYFGLKAMNNLGVPAYIGLGI